MIKKKLVVTLMVGLSLFVMVGCNNNANSKEKESVEVSSPKLPSVALTKVFLSNAIQKTDASDIDAIKSSPQKLLFAYYYANNKTADDKLRWYISATGGSLAGYIFSLGEIESVNGVEKVSWREVSSGAASVDLINEQINIGDIADNPTHSFKDWGLGIDKVNPSIQEDIDLIKNSSVDVKWWFFQAPNDAWYIIDKQNHIHKFGISSGEYDWQEVNTTTFQMEFYMEGGVKKIKLPDPFVAPKKTGQTTSYDEAGNVVADETPRDDGHYQKGTTPSYTRDDGNETVLDNITGLMWQDDAAVASVRKQWLTDDNYNTCNSGRTDPACFDTTGDTATTYCRDLVMGGHEDWRLPTSVELEGIVNYGVRSPAIDTTKFQNTVSSFYWSSTSIVGVENGAWFVLFDGGVVGGDFKYVNHYVRCVRDGQ